VYDQRYNNGVGLIKFYQHLEKRFEKVTSFATALLGNSVTFIIALIMVIIWLSNIWSYHNDLHHSIGDLILGFTFLSLFIIQKSFNRFSASLHLKVNELVSSHETASNAVINLEEKTEKEITELSNEYKEISVLKQKIEMEMEIKTEAVTRPHLLKSIWLLILDRMK
jgi:low affinity Fe/Cu permease